MKNRKPTSSYSVLGAYLRDRRFESKFNAKRSYLTGIVICISKFRAPQINFYTDRDIKGFVTCLVCGKQNFTA
jgi:hypothetical protein